MSFDLTQMLFVLMFFMTVVAFLVAINSRGAVKMAFSYVLATAMLIVSVYQVVTYIGESKLKRQMQHARALEEARRRAEMEEANKQAAKYGDFLKSIAMRGKPIAQGMRNLDLRDESVEIDYYFSQAASARSRANALLNELKTRECPDKYKTAKATLEKAIRQTLSAAKYLSLYFKSEDEYEEERREKALYSSVRSASTLYDQVVVLADKH